MFYNTDEHPLIGRGGQNITVGLCPGPCRRRPSTLGLMRPVCRQGGSRESALPTCWTRGLWLRQGRRWGWPPSRRHKHQAVIHHATGLPKAFDCGLWLWQVRSTCCPQQAWKVARPLKLPIAQVQADRNLGLQHLCCPPQTCCRLGDVRLQKG